MGEGGVELAQEGRAYQEEEAGNKATEIRIAWGGHCVSKLSPTPLSPVCACRTNDGRKRNSSPPGASARQPLAVPTGLRHDASSSEYTSRRAQGN